MAELRFDPGQRPGIRPATVGSTGSAEKQNAGKRSCEGRRGGRASARSLSRGRSGAASLAARAPGTKRRGSGTEKKGEERRKSANARPAASPPAGRASTRAMAPPPAGPPGGRASRPAHLPGRRGRALYRGDIPLHVGLTAPHPAANQGSGAGRQRLGRSGRSLGSAAPKALCAAQARGRRRAEVTALARRGNEKLAGCVTR
ncbi:hypothetical protein J1605_005664 [Eschrichtius robustus]|uniref:Uncharacterized protein n=1 Tax=Eschrichtius robustus TaxID=9764 RepID=A0AB34HAS6_ESCRO|nr:hypothetical protein J1605_005664 [Eschrichtius robustus]